MLAVSNIRPHVIQTERPLHATEIAQSLDLDLYDAIATVSGDGLFHEMLNGMAMFGVVWCGSVWRDVHVDVWYVMICTM